MNPKFLNKIGLKRWSEIPVKCCVAPSQSPRPSPPLRKLLLKSIRSRLVFFLTLVLAHQSVLFCTGGWAGVVAKNLGSGISQLIPTEHLHWLQGLGKGALAASTSHLGALRDLTGLLGGLNELLYIKH